MHLSLWKPLSNYATKIMGRRAGDESVGAAKQRPPHPPSSSALRQLQEHKLREALEDASENRPLSKPEDNDEDGLPGRSTSLAKLNAQKEFLQATSLAAARLFYTEESIPDYQEAFLKFLSMYPKFQSSERIIHQLRLNEYSHLSDPDSKVCLDYCGFGLFSYSQTVHCWNTSSFTLKQITANLNNQALHGGAEEGTMEHDIKLRIMDYLHIPENEYALVFTASRGSAFKLVSEFYPFHKNKNLLTMFDHESQSVNWMAQCAKQKGAKVSKVWFSWPTLNPCSEELRKEISLKRKRRKASAVGLFAFPVQSRVTGATYSYQWMALAQQKNWHVLLDAGSLGPKDMDSLGLSLFRPDFIITSFYKVFGSDPTGFGCLLIKKSVMPVLQSQPGQTGTDMVKIVPELPQYHADSLEQCCLDGEFGFLEEGLGDNKLGESHLPAFSGVFTSEQVKGVFNGEIDLEDDSSDRDGSSTIYDEADSEDGLSVYSSRIHSGQIPNGSDQSGQLLSRKECDFMLLGRREQMRHSDGRFLIGRRDPETTCRHLDHVDTLGLNKTSPRLRYLTNWLITSLLQLQFLKGGTLVQIYGPKIKYERGASIAFNIRESRRGGLIHPETVQKLAEKHGISLGVGILSHIQQVVDGDHRTYRNLDGAHFTPYNLMSSGCHDKKNRLFRIEVVTATLGFLTNFEDVYRMWVFVAKFLNPFFVDGEGLEES
ncbi:unnamed protein product [Cuscuta epithymum]|uniref:Molybdenum cofactor sulfurase n=1 Tax=Cuscuta epithymum TaxID=186058 RepID=A0AAV0DWG4_9ASTE|nr:unnamed protein product [Cuscuta epithymum]